MGEGIGRRYYSIVFKISEIRVTGCAVMDEVRDEAREGMGYKCKAVFFFFLLGGGEDLKVVLTSKY